jgi:hypothetical protein
MRMAPYFVVVAVIGFMLLLMAVAFVVSLIRWMRQPAVVRPTLNQNPAPLEFKGPRGFEVKMLTGVPQDTANGSMLQE